MIEMMNHFGFIERHPPLQTRILAHPIRPIAGVFGRLTPRQTAALREQPSRRRGEKPCEGRGIEPFTLLKIVKR